MPMKHPSLCLLLLLGVLGATSADPNVGITFASSGPNVGNNRSQHVAHTTDGGSTWTAGTSPTVPGSYPGSLDKAIGFNGVFFLAGSIVKDNPKSPQQQTFPAIWESTDGGVSWGIAFVETAEPWSTSPDKYVNSVGICFVGDVGLAAYHTAQNTISHTGSRIYRTTDGGATWVLAFNNTYEPTSLACTDEEFLMGVKLGVGRSTDGVTWSLAGPPGMGNGLVRTIQPTVLVAVLLGNKVIFSNTSGTRYWSPVVTIQPYQGDSLTLTNAVYTDDALYLVGSAKQDMGPPYMTIFSSDDGGKSFDLAFQNKKNGPPWPFIGNTALAASGGFLMSGAPYSGLQVDMVGTNGTMKTVYQYDGFGHHYFMGSRELAFLQ